jgi:hypothetical protein
LKRRFKKNVIPEWSFKLYLSGEWMSGWSSSKSRIQSSIGLEHKRENRENEETRAEFRRMG